MSFAEDALEEVLGHCAARPATLGTGRLICIDGPAGSGKSTLAGQLAARTSAPVVHMDDLFPGWDGIRRAAPQVRRLLAALARGETGCYRRYDWGRTEFTETRRVEPAPLVVLEGVASGDVTWAAWTTTLVWVETERAERLRRGLARDGDAVEPQWVRWMAAEDVLFAERRTRARADVVLVT